MWCLSTPPVFTPFRAILKAPTLVGDIYCVFTAWRERTERRTVFIGTKSIRKREGGYSFLFWQNVKIISFGRGNLLDKCVEMVIL